MSYRVGALLTHPIQYYSPWLAVLARHCELKVYYAHRQDGAGQAEAGFGVAFDWDVPLLDGYEHRFLRNVATRPGLGRFAGCDTPEIGAILRREQFDAFLLFGWNRKSLVQGWVGARRAGTPVFVRLDNQLDAQSSPARRLVKRAVYPLILPWHADYLSPGQRTDAYLHAYKVPDRRIHRVPHMVDTERFATRAEAARASGEVARLRQAHGAEADDFIFLFVGKLIDVKRPRLLLDALRALGGASAKLWIAGDGPLRADLERNAAARGLDIRFLGFVNQGALPAIYATADCLVLPSEHETWGLVVNEAFACGLPAIVSDAAGCAPELIEEGRTGWVMRGDDPREVVRVFTQARNCARTLPRTAVAEMSERFGYAEGTERFLAAVASRRARDRC